MKISPFQVIVLAIFALALVGGVIVLALTKSKTGSGSGVPVVIWGTMSSASFNASTADITQGNGGLKINYIEKRPENFDQDLLEALASGAGPDAILLPQDLIVRHRDKILPISYNQMSLPSFKSTFIQEGELFLDPNGILALPFSVDPLVMYWNRDLLSNAGLARVPQTWEEFIALSQKLTVKDKSGNILKSAVALGEFRNIANAKEIISTLLLQAGNGISDGLKSLLNPPTLATIGAINFYTDFANPVKPDYSWNRALPNSLNMFTAGDLAFYFGFAGEISKIRDKNPNLNFDVTFFPQPKGASVTTTFGKMQGLAVLKASRNSADAITAVLALTGVGPLGLLAKATGLPPVRRDMLSVDPSDPYQGIFNNSAIRARGWLDPNPLSSSAIFQDMIESVTGGEREAGNAIDVAGKNLTNLFR